LTSISFPITFFEVVCFKKWIWLFSSIFFSVKLSISHDLGERFIWVDQFFYVAFLSVFILSNKFWFFLKSHFVFCFSYIELSCLYNPTRGFWQFHLIFLMLCFLILFFSLNFFPDFILLYFYSWDWGSLLF